MEYNLKVDSFSRGAEDPPQRQYPAPVYQAPLLVVTSFSPAGYEDYGRRFLETFVRFWPREVVLACFYEGEKPDVEDARIWYFDLKRDRDLQDWMMRYGNDPKARGMKNGVRDFRWDAVRFAPKVFSLTSPLLPMTGWRVWIDADVETTAPIPDTFFSKLLRTGAVAAYLGRSKEVFATSECGFVAYHTGMPAGRQFLIDLRANYMLGKIFGFPEWHDSAVFDVLRGAYEEAGSYFKDLAKPWYDTLKGPLTFEEHGHPWPHTPLGQVFTHYKGPKGKERAISHQPDEVQAVDLQRLCNDPAITSRYQQIARIMQVLPHESIVEVGVAEGERAVGMCSINLERGKKVKYTGFDLFEGITPEISEQEYNGKAVSPWQRVAERLDALKMKYPGLLEWELVKGNTRETLPKHKFDDVDIAFIDGGHSVETIESDFRALEKHCGLILLDDYYEAGVDTEKFGCNKLYASLKDQKTLLPKADTFGEQKIRIAAWGKILKRPGESMPIRIKTKNCVEDSEIQAHIRNAATYRDVVWLPTVCRPIDDPVIFVGGSDSVCKPENEDYAANWRWVKTFAETGYRVAVCKTSYKAAFREGVLPWACLLLDPRDHVAQWVDPIDERVNYFIASMCHPTTWAHVCRPGVKVYGYHAGVGAQEAPLIAELWGDAPIVHGGTTSSFRGLSLLYNMGFRKFRTVGLDSSYKEKPEKPHGRSEKPVQQVTIGKDQGIARNFWTDPELIAQSQDAEMIAKLHPTLDIEYFGDGLLQHAQKIMRRMIEGAGPLALAPREQLFAVWQQTLKGKQILPESLFIDDLIYVLEERRAALHAELWRQPAFDELVTEASERKAA